MAAQTQRIILKEILIEDLDHFLKPETGAKPVAIQNEREETGMSRTLLNKLEQELSNADGFNLSDRGSYPHDLRRGLSRSPSTSKGKQVDDRGGSSFPESGILKSKNPFRLRRLEDAIVILGRVKDPRPILSNMDVVDEAQKHLRGTLEAINVNGEEKSKFSLAADDQESSVDIARSTNVDCPESSFSIEQESVAIDITKTYQDSSNSSSNLNSLKEDEMTLINQHFSGKPIVISHLQDAITTSSSEFTSDRPLTRNNHKSFMSRVNPSQLSSSLEAELQHAQSSKACDLPIPVSMTACPEDADWWRNLPQRQEFEAQDGKEDVDPEVLLNYSRMNDFETYLGLSGRELGGGLTGPKDIDDPRSTKKKLERLLRGNTNESQSPAAPCEKRFMKKRNFTRSSPRLRRTSGLREESESKDAVEGCKDGIENGKYTKISESKRVLTDVGDQLKCEDKVLIDDVCRPMSLRSRRSSGIEVVSVTSDKLEIEETKAGIQLVDLSFQQEEMKHKSQHSVRMTDKKLRPKHPPLLHCDWLVGDLLWAKMAGHPWWPCILTYDPSLGLYTRSSTVGRVVRTRFHVRFFGEKPYHAWIAEGSILQFKGVEAFKRLCAQLSKTDLVHRSQNYYKVVDSRRRAWEFAVEEAEKIGKLTRKDRLLKCNSVSGTDSLKRSTADESGRSRKERGKSASFEKGEQKTPEYKKRRRSEPHVQAKSRAKDALSADDSLKLTDRKEDQDGNCRKEESKQEAAKLSGGASGGMRKGTVCLSCEQDVPEEELVSCEGSCLGSFHRTCLGLAVGPLMPFVCDECTTGSHTCFVCKMTSVETVRCSVSLCGRFYHLECIQKLRLAHADKRRLHCPLHTCATCTADDIKNPLASKGSLLRCVRCPTAYHSSDVCLAAGCERLSGNAIVCSRHLMKSTSQQHVNVNWCFLCSKGGTLLCCESCPAAFHMDCLKLVAPPVGSWECEECTDGKRPLSGEIVWAKLGNYRWWPGEIYHPQNIPDSLMGAAHQKGEFPVRFFGTHNYFWANIGRVFLFQEDDKGSKESVRNGLDKSFSRAVQEANAAIRVWMVEKLKRDEKSKAKADRKPPPYKHLKACTVVGNVSVHRFNLDDIHPCSCHLDMVDPCGPESKCLNRDLSYECHPVVCPVGDHCQNRRFQRREYVSVVPFKTETRGWGLKTLVDVKEGQFVIEYVGELIDLDECRRRMKEMQTRKNSSFYLLTLDKDRIIDAGPRGNVSRFMNHSCQPNCETQKWTVNGDSRIGLFSVADIPAGSELTFNYNLDCLGNEKLACHCGSAICSGYLGLRPKQSTAVLAESSKKKRKRRVKKSFVRIHENECFRCGKTGQLIMCDKSQCPKVYHLKCLHLKKAPHGKWICPWHHCDECGQPSTQLCNECDNSFCVDHIKGNISERLPGYLICSVHGEWKPSDETSLECSVETGLGNEEPHSEKLGLCGIEVWDSDLKKCGEGKLEENGKNSKKKRNWRRLSLGMSEKNVIGKRKKELSTDARIQSEAGTKLLQKALKNDSSSVASRKKVNGKGSSTRKKMLSHILSRSKDGSKLSRTEKKTLKICRKRKRNETASASSVSEKDSTTKYQTKRRRKSLPENEAQSEDVVKCFRTESEHTSNVSSKCNGKRRQTISVIDFKGQGAAKLKRKRDKSLGASFTLERNKHDDVELSAVRTELGDQKTKSKSRKSSLKVVPAKRTKTDCTLEKGYVAVPGDSTEARIKGAKESRKKSLKIKDIEEGEECQKLLKKPRNLTEVAIKGTKESRRKYLKTKDIEEGKKCRKLLKKPRDLTESSIKGTKECRKYSLNNKDTKEGKKCRKLLKKAVCSVRASKKELGLSKKSLALLKLPVVQKRKVTRPKISNTSKKMWIVETEKSTYAKDLKRALELSLSDMQHEAEFHNNALKSIGGKLKQGEAQKRRKSRRFMKHSDNNDCRNMETEEEIKLTDAAQVEATEMTRLMTNDIAVTEHFEIMCDSEKEVSHLDVVVTDAKCKIEGDSKILKLQDESVTHQVKLTKKKVLKIKGQKFGSGKIKKIVMQEQSIEDNTGSKIEGNNLEVEEGRIGSQWKVQDLEDMNHSGLPIEAREIEVESQKDSMNQTEKGVGMRSEKEIDNLENVSSHELQRQVVVGEISDDSMRESEEIISEAAKNIQSLPDSLVIDRCSSKFKANFYDTPSDSSESDVICILGGDSPDVKDSKGWDKGTERNDSESGCSSRSKIDERKVIVEGNSVELETNCRGMSAIVDSSDLLDKIREECPTGEKFPFIAKAAEIHEVMTDESQLLEVLQSAGSVENVAKFSDKDGVTSPFVADGSSEMKVISGVEDDNRPARHSVEFVREPGWKLKHKISLGNASLKPNDDCLKDCDVFPRTY